MTFTKYRVRTVNAGCTKASRCGLWNTALLDCMGDFSKHTDLFSLYLLDAIRGPLITAALDLKTDSRRYKKLRGPLE